MRAMIDEPKKGFLEELQSLSEPTKRKIMIVATVVIMAVVIYVWLAYFNNLLASVGQPTVAENTGAASVPSGSDFAQGTKSGMAFIYDIFLKAVHGLAGIWEAPRQYNIQPPQ